MTLHVGRLLTENARLRPDAPALVDGRTGEATTYAALDARAASIAGALSSRVVPGDRVVLCAHSSADAVAAFFAIVHCGGVVVPVPTRAAARELAFRTQHSGARVVLVDAETEALAEGVPAAVLPIHALEGVARRLQPSPDGGAMVLYTSGTTGVSRGAVIQHDSLCAHTAALVHHVLRLTPEDAVLGVLPLAHSYGIRMAILAPFYAGARTVFAPGRFDPSGSLALAAEHAVTWIPGVPTMFSAWGRTAGEPWPELRWALSAGAPLPTAVRERASVRLGAPVREGYGLTEATFTAIAEDDAPGVGRSVWGVDVRIVAPKERPHGSELPAGEVGEIQVRGQNVMAGYLEDPLATEEAFDGEWLRTGDLGLLDGEGRLQIVDRIKDLILRGGVNVVPAEVEGVLAAYPGVLEVAVVGRPDEHLGEEIVAVLVLDSTARLDALARHAHAELGAAKAPREWVTLDALPQGATGKVLRRALRDDLRAGALSPERL